MQQNQAISQSSHSKNNNQETKPNIIYFLVNQIGININAAQILIHQNECNNTQQALNLMLKNNEGFYNHKFISSKQNQQQQKLQTSQQVCLLCGQIAGIHIVRKKKLSFGINHQSDNQLNKPHQFINDFIDVLLDHQAQILDEASFQCCICYGNFSWNFMAIINQVQHRICRQCMFSYVKQEISQMRVADIQCPHCGLRFDQKMVQKFSLADTFLKYKQVQKNPNLIWCPNPKCSVIISIKKKKKTFECPKCLIKICIKCNNQAHSGYSCKSVLKKQLNQWQNSQNIQKCRKCLALVQKISGCNHMTCSVCNHQWCWICGANYNSTHFNNLNPFGCPGMQDRHDVSRGYILVKQVFIILAIIVGLPLCLPLGLVIAGPLVMIEMVYRHINYRQCWKRIPAMLALILAGLVLNPFIWIGLIVVFLPKFFSFICEEIQSRRALRENAENNLQQRLINAASQNQIIIQGDQSTNLLRE